jgi:hypothetical protein
MPLSAKRNAAALDSLLSVSITRWQVDTRKVMPRTKKENDEMHLPLAVDALQETDIALCAQRLLPIPQKKVNTHMYIYIHIHIYLYIYIVYSVIAKLSLCAPLRSVTRTCGIEENCLVPALCPSVIAPLRSIRIYGKKTKRKTEKKEKRKKFGLRPSLFLYSALYSAANKNKKKKSKIHNNQAKKAFSIHNKERRTQQD